MKLQCACGAKYEFEITPDMAERPVQFVCPACGADSSDFVNGLVRQQLGLGPVAATSAAAPAAVPVAAPTARPAVRMHVHSPEAAPAAEAMEEADGPPLCLKHPGEIAEEKCYICSKPICPKCMELFGYVCSPLCKAKAEARGIEIPVFAGQKSVVEAKLWRKVAWVSGIAGTAVVAVFAFWFWYAWFGSIPKTLYSVRFAEPAYSGQTWTFGPDRIVFLHGGTLAMHDLKQKKEIWSRYLLDKKQIEADATKEIKELQNAAQLAWQVNPESKVHVPSFEKLTASMERNASAALDLRVQGQNIWVLSPGKLVRYDRETGNPIKEMPLKSSTGELISRGDELLLMDGEGPQETVTHINLDTCESRTEPIFGPPSTVADEPKPPPPGTASTQRPGRPRDTAGLPIGMPGRDMGKVMDPQKVAQQAQKLSKPAQIALPALLANSMNQERIMAELNDEQKRAPDVGAATPAPQERFALMPTKDGFVQFSVSLIESHIVERSAMKAPPTKSVLNGNLNVNQTADVANEILNEMQRSRGGDVVQENESRYRVMFRRPDGKDEWSGEVIGPPEFYPLDSVNVLAANKLILVFDKTNKKLWQSPLTHNIDPAVRALDAENVSFGQGPCVEHKGRLYVFDQGVLTAFDAATGTVHWRLPSVGIQGMFFDDRDNIYLNTSSASPERLKYSRQIDISDKVNSVVMKIDSRSGKTLWSHPMSGVISYVSGPFVYNVQSYGGDEYEGDGVPPMPTGMETPPHVRVRRINPKNGHEMWEHYEERAPVDVRFDKNTIRLVFKKEVKVLKFVSF